MAMNQITVESSEERVGAIVHNAKCSDCGCLMKTAEIREGGKVFCRSCFEPLTGFCGTVVSGHYDDDPSGASGSWDCAVKLNEGE